MRNNSAPNIIVAAVLHPDTKKQEAKQEAGCEEVRALAVVCVAKHMFTEHDLRDLSPFFKYTL